MDSQDRATQQLHDTLKECFEQIRFARAAELARSRRYLEAEGLLSPNGRESSNPRELDLLARISAQQRRYGRARQLWEAALQRSPENADYKRAIECTREAERFQAVCRKAAVIVFLSLAVAALLLAVWGYFRRHTPSSAGSEDKRPNVQASPTALPPATPQPAPATPQPAPTTPQPAPATPQPAPATPQPAPATPQPAPATPQPTAPQPATPPVPPPLPESQ
jgi:hypothetical protein